MYSQSVEDSVAFSHSFDRWPANRITSARGSWIRQRAAVRPCPKDRKLRSPVFLEDSSRDPYC